MGSLDDVGVSRMGYILNTLKTLAVDETVEYYIFLLHNGFADPVVASIKSEFSTLSDKVGDAAVFAMGTNPEGFSKEVLAQIFKFDPDTKGYIGPALLVTDGHPKKLGEWNLRLLIPLVNIEKRVENGISVLLRELTEYTNGQNSNFLSHFQEDENSDNAWEAAKRIYEITDFSIPVFWGVSIKIKPLTKIAQKIAQTF